MARTTSNTPASHRVLGPLSSSIRQPFIRFLPTRAHLARRRLGRMLTMSLPLTILTNRTLVVSCLEACRPNGS
ncbi:hypothetical protein OG21DRAFT_636397 [Imleria badia]|nr:hypothetical protein OG21DRAFT_636397 [Imleria badia]